MSKTPYFPPLYREVDCGQCRKETGVTSRFYPEGAPAFRINAVS